MQVCADQTMFPNTLYCEGPSLFSGCKIVCDSSDTSAYVGDTVDVTGQTGVDSDGEWYIDATQSTSSSGDITVDSSGPPPGLHGMTNAAIGGKYNGTPGQGVTNGVGLINSGWLVRTWGTVVYVDPGSTFFLMDDGSRVSNSASGTILGLRVDLTSGMIAPEAGWVLGVNGVSSCDSAGGVIYRVLRPRTQADFTLYNPQETSGPSVAITAPADGTVHIDSSGSNSVVIAGTATSQTLVTNIKVNIDSTGWVSLSNFTPSASVAWTCNWANVTAGSQTHSISVTATDYAGRSATATKTGITVSNVSVIYVDPNGTGSGQNQWQGAYTTVTAGMNAASSGRDIWVAEGMYQEAGTINLKAGVGLYGGFAGTERAREDRNWATNKTILDGSGTHTVVNIDSGGTATNTCIDGFVIQNGYCNNANGGGGVYCYNASGTIADSIIRNNDATNYWGGGVYVTGNLSNPIIAGNVFSGNKAEDGGGICFDGSQGQITNNTIIGNLAAIYGGGMNLYAYHTIALSNNIVAFNTGGGAYYSSGVTFAKNDVYGNGDYNYYNGIAYTVPSADLAPQDPLIPNIAWGDWNLAHNSPCINAGSNTVTLPSSLDIDGQPRWRNGSIDIGADEWWTDPAPGPATVIYVGPSGADSAAGTSWGNAVATVQRGITLASNAGGGQVWVAAGKTYTKAGSAATVANVEPFVYVYGGFAGTETLLSQRNWTTNQTILDGGGSGSVVTMNGVSFCQIDGFTIQHGSGYLNGYKYCGGGIYCSYSSTTIANDTITSDSAGSGYSDGYGGGIYCYYSSGTISNCAVSNNTACDDGGGIWCSNSPFPITNCTVTSNTCGGSGGGICCDSTASMTNDTVTNNQAGYGSGGGVSASTLSAADCTISSNYANGSGGGVSAGTLSMTGCIVENNQSAGCGDGIACGGTSPSTISGSTIAGNTSTPSNAWGGGGIWCEGGPSIAICSNTITSNACHGIICEACTTATVSGNTIAGNYGTADIYGDDDWDEDEAGGGVYFDGTGVSGATVNISGNIIGGATASLGNTAPYEGGGIFCNSITATIDSNLIQNNVCLPYAGNTAGTRGGGMSMRSCPGSVVTNNVFAYNLTNGSPSDVPGGGAIYANASAPAIVNNTFVYNGSGSGNVTNPSTFTRKLYGGAIQIDYGYNGTPASIVNNVFYGNLAENGNSVAFTDSAAGTISYCDAYPDAGTYLHYVHDTQSSFTLGSECVNQDPIFVSINSGNPANDNYHLTYSSPNFSPCVDVGHINGAAPYNTVPTKDKDGYSRPDNNESNCDMGAYEVQL